MNDQWTAEEASTAGPERPEATATGSIKRPAIKSFFWSALSFGSNKFVVFASTLFLARLLAPASFGVVAAGMTVVTYLEIGLDLGIGAAVIYEQEEGVTSRVQTAFTLNLAMSALLTASALVLAPEVAVFFRVPGQEAIFRALALYLLLRGTGQVHEAVLKRDLKFKQRMVVDTSRAIVRAVVSVVLAFMGLEAWAIVWGLLAGEVVGAVLNWSFVPFVPNLSLDRSAAAPMLRYGLAVLVIDVLYAVNANSDYLVVGNRLGATQLGFYTIGYRLPELVIRNVYWIFSGVAFPVYAKARNVSPEVFRHAMLRALRMTTLFGFSVGTGLALVARDAIPVLFGTKWLPSVAPMAIIALAMAFDSVGYASGDIFPAVGRPGLLIKLEIPLTAMLVAGFVFAAPHGLAAVATVHLVFYLVYGLLRLVLANHLLGSCLRQELAAMRPAAWVTAGILTFVLPIRFVLAPGGWSLVSMVAFGSIGGFVGLMLGAREMADELKGLVRQAVVR